MLDKFDLTKETDRELLSECLTQMLSLPDSTVDDTGLKRLPLRQVLSYVWHTGRLADCKAKLAAGKRAQEIMVTRVVVGDDALYIIEDGNHRSEAARQMGKKLITGCVTCTYYIRLSKYGLWHDCLWRYLGKGEWQQKSSGKLPTKTIDGLKRLGILQRIA